MSRIRLVLLISLSSLAVPTLPEVASAATIATGATCSLRDAIASANSNTAVGGCVAGAVGIDKIVVTAAVLLSIVDNGTGSDANGLPVITEDLIIKSNVSGVRVPIQRSTAVGTPDFRFFEIDRSAAPTVWLRDLYISFGSIVGSPAVAAFPVGAAGGCIKMGGGSLTIINSIIEECRVQGSDNAVSGGGDARGGAIYAANGSLTLVNSTISFGSVQGGEALAPGFFGGKAAGGGVEGLALTLNVVGSTIVSNFAVGGNGIDAAGTAEGGGVSLIDSVGTMTGSLVIANATAGGVSTLGGDSALSQGGGLSVVNSTLTLNGTEVEQNVANGQDSAQARGGYAYGGGLHARASTLDLINSSVIDNRASGGYGYVSNADGYARGAGLHLLDTTATIKTTAIEQNSVEGYAARGGGIYESNADPAATPLIIKKSTLDGNIATATHGQSHGGGFFQDVGAAVIKNSTISNNIADIGGGFAVYAATSLTSSYAVDSSVEMTNVTVSTNAATINGGGAFIEGFPIAPNGVTLSLYNSTVTNNTNDGIHLVHSFSDPELIAQNNIVGDQASGVDCVVDGAAILTSLGGNLESATDCGFIDATDQQSVFYFGLDSLADNGGSTLTHALLVGSPAVDAGLNQSCNQKANGKDQRGLPRFYDGDGDGIGQCDSGAVELQ